MKKQIIFLELNEVPLLLFERFANSSPPFKRLFTQFSVYRTLSIDNVHLSPWITWATVHRGVTHEFHGIENFGQDLTERDKEYPPIWQRLKSRGLSVGVYGSLHSSNLPEDFSQYDFYVPDPFASHSVCNPKTLSFFQEFQLHLSRKSARNVDPSIGAPNLIALFRSLLSAGLTLRTVYRIAYQIFSERLNRARLSRRRVLQASINFDIFKTLLYRHNPSFSTFFTNHVASSLHRYWEASFPGDYSSPVQSIKWCKTFRHEIPHAMNTATEFIAELMKYVDHSPNAELWVCTSMGQSPVEGYEAIKSQLYLVNPSALLAFLGLDSSAYTIEPTMAPRVTFRAATQRDNFALVESLRGFMIAGKALEVMTGCNSATLRIMHWNVLPSLTFNGSDVLLSDAGFEMVDISDSSGTSAYHIPEGVLMIYGKDSGRYGRDQVIQTEVISSLIESCLD